MDDMFARWHETVVGPEVLRKSDPSGRLKPCEENSLWKNFSFPLLSAFSGKRGQPRPPRGYLRKEKPVRDGAAL